MSLKNTVNANESKKADWEIDFYSRPIIESDGKKRWELLIASSQDLLEEEIFRWEKKCPADEVNSIWLSDALAEALIESKERGWEAPKRLRTWRTSMKTMIKKAAEKVDLEVIESRRTYSLFNWLKQREKDIYPNEEGYISGPFAPTPSRILNQAIPLPEALRGDTLSMESLTIEALKEAKEWPIEFNGLVAISSAIDQKITVPGLRLFSKNRSLALSAWISGIEPVRLVIANNQLLLEAGQEDRWLVTNFEDEYALEISKDFTNTRERAEGIQFIAVQSSPEDEKFDGFWMLRDIEYD